MSISNRHHLLEGFGTLGSESPCWERWTRPPLSHRRSGGRDFQRAGIQIFSWRCCASVVKLSSCLLMSEQGFKNFESFWHNLTLYVSGATWWLCVICKLDIFSLQMIEESFENFEFFLTWFDILHIWANLMVMRCAVSKSIPLVVAVAQEGFFALVEREVGDGVFNIDIEFKSYVEWWRQSQKKNRGRAAKNVLEATLAQAKI